MKRSVKKFLRMLNQIQIFFRQSLLFVTREIRRNTARIITYLGNDSKQACSLGERRDHFREDRDRLIIPSSKCKQKSMEDDLRREWKAEHTNKSNNIRREEFRGRRYEELQDRRILTWLNLLNNRYFVIKLGKGGKQPRRELVSALVRY